MANKQSAVDKSKQLTVPFGKLMAMGMSKETKWPGIS